MASSDQCMINLEKFSEPERKAIAKQVQAVIKKAELNSDISDLNEAIEAGLNDYSKWVETAAKVAKRNAYLNKRAQQNIIDNVLSNWNDDPAEGLMSFLVGSQIERTGARNSVATSIDNFQNKYKNTLRLKLIKDDVWREFKSGAFDKEIYIAMDAIHKGKKAAVSEVASKIASIVDSVNRMMRTDANKYGAMIGELDGFVVSRGHDQFKIAKNQKAWVEWMQANIDWNRSYLDLAPEDRVKALTEQANEFAAGTHVTFTAPDDPGKGLAGFASIGKKMSRNRVIHFLTPEAEYEYSQKFGSEGLMNALISNIESRGRSIGMMSRLGPNAEMNLANAGKRLIEHYKKSGLGSDKKMEAIAKAQEYIDRSIMPILTGRTAIPGNYIGATLESLFLTLQRTSSLGGSAVVSVIGDSTVGAMNVARQTGNMADYFTGLGEYFSGMFRNLKDDEVQELLADLQVTNDFMFARMNPRFSEDTAAITKTQRNLQAWENTFFFANGQYFVDSRARAASAIGMATRFGHNTGKSLDQLGDGYKRLLDIYGIGSTEWDIARQSLKDYKGAKVMDIEGIDKLPDSEFAAYLSNKGVKATKYQLSAAKREIMQKFRSMFQDQQGYSILSADARLRAKMFGGDKAGTGIGFVRKAFWQFKQFPASFVQKAIGRELYANSPVAAKVANLAAGLVATTVAGYIALQVTELRKGRTPKPFNGQVVFESMIKGGGLGIYGDFIYSMYQDRFGNSAVTKFMGPMFSDIENLVSGLSKIGQGITKSDSKMIDGGKDTLAKLGMSNIPFANVFYLKPILDYAIMNQMMEAVSPGVLRRSESRIRKDYDQKYFMMKPSETMLFK